MGLYYKKPTPPKEEERPIQPPVEEPKKKLGLLKLGLHKPGLFQGITQYVFGGSMYLPEYLKKVSGLLIGKYKQIKKELEPPVIDPILHYKLALRGRYDLIDEMKEAGVVVPKIAEPIGIPRSIQLTPNEERFFTYKQTSDMTKQKIIDDERKKEIEETGRWERKEESYYDKLIPTRIQETIDEVKKKKEELLNEKESIVDKDNLESIRSALEVYKKGGYAFDHRVRDLFEEGVADLIDESKLNYDDVSRVYFFKPLTKRTDIMGPDYALTLLDGAKEAFFSGLLKVETEPETLGEQISWTIGQAGGTIGSLILTGAILKNAALLTKTGRTFFTYSKYLPYGGRTTHIGKAPFLSEMFKSIGAFNIHGQLRPELGTDWDARLDSALMDTGLAVVFNMTGVVFPGKLGIPAQGILFGGLSYISGDPWQVVATNTLVGMGLHGANLLKEKDIMEVHKNQARRNLSKYEKIKSGYSDRDINLARDKGKSEAMKEKDTTKRDTEIDSLERSAKLLKGYEPKKRAFTSDKNIINNLKRSIRQVKEELQTITKLYDKIKLTPADIEKVISPTEPGQPKIVDVQKNGRARIVVKGMQSQLLPRDIISAIQRGDTKQYYIIRLNQLEKEFAKATGREKQRIGKQIDNLIEMGVELGYEGKRLTDVVRRYDELDVQLRAGALSEAIEELTNVSINVLGATKERFDPRYLPKIRKTIQEIAETKGIPEKDIAKEFLRRVKEKETGKEYFRRAVSEREANSLLAVKPAKEGAIDTKEFLLERPMKRMVPALKEQIKGIKDAKTRSEMIEKAIRAEYPKLPAEEMKRLKSILGAEIRGVEPKKPVKVPEKKAEVKPEVKPKVIEPEVGVKVTEKQRAKIEVPSGTNLPNVYNKAMKKAGLSKQQISDILGRVELNKVGKFLAEDVFNAITDYNLSLKKPVEKPLVKPKEVKPVGVEPKVKPKEVPFEKIKVERAKEEAKEIKVTKKLEEAKKEERLKAEKPEEVKPLKKTVKEAISRVKELNDIILKKGRKGEKVADELAERSKLREKLKKLDPERFGKEIAERERVARKEMEEMLNVDELIPEDQELVRSFGYKDKISRRDLIMLTERDSDAKLGEPRAELTPEEARNIEKALEDPDIPEATKQQLRDKRRGYLHMGFDPGVRTFFTEDVAPTGEKAWEFAKQVGMALRLGMSPSTINWEAGATAAIIREKNAEFYRIAEAAYRVRIERVRLWNKLSDDFRYKFLDIIEHDLPMAKIFEGATKKDFNYIREKSKGKSSVVDMLESLRQEYRERLDRSFELSLSVTDKIRYRKHYFPHIWKSPIKARRVFEDIERDLGRERFANMRLIDFIAEGRKRGLKLLTTNPEELVLIRERSSWQAKAQSDMINGLRDLHLLRTSKQMDKRVRNFLYHLGTEYRGRLGETIWKKLSPKLKNKITETMEKDLAIEGFRKELKGNFSKNDVKILRGEMAKVERLIPADTIYGRFFMPEAAKNVLEKHLKTRLWSRANVSGKIFRGLMRLKNVTVAAKLALSAFHIVETGTSAAATQWVLATRYAMMKDWKGFVREIKYVPIAPLRDFGMPFADWAIKKYPKLKGTRWEKILKKLAGPGAKLIEAFYTGTGPEWAKEAAHLITEGGGRVHMSKIYRVNMRENFRRAWEKENFFGAGVRFIPAALETLATPMFDYWVPRMKVMSYYRLAKQWILRNPEASSLERKIALSRMWDSADNRFGQLVYDNLFWNPWIRDIGILTTLSMGWQLGMVREFVGAGKDFVNLALGKGIKKGAKFDSYRFSKSLERMSATMDKNPALKVEVSDRVLYASFYAILFGLMGGTINWALTGKPPTDILSFFYPKTGDKNADGTDTRLQPPSMLKEIPRMWSHWRKQGLVKGSLGALKNKQAPVWSSLIGLWENKDFYGTEIYSPYDPWFKKHQAMLVYFILQNFETISISTYRRMKEQGQESLAPIAFAGYIPAPKYITTSKTAEKIYDTYRMREGEAVRTKESKRISDARGDLRKKYQKGELTYSELDKAVEEGILKEKGLNQFLARAMLPSDIRTFGALGEEDQHGLLLEMSDDDVSRYLPYATKDIKTKWKFIDYDEI